MCYFEQGEWPYILKIYSFSRHNFYKIGPPIDLNLDGVIICIRGLDDDDEISNYLEPWAG